jgi:hypothetical protein
MQSKEEAFLVKKIEENACFVIRCVNRVSRFGLFV